MALKVRGWPHTFQTSFWLKCDEPGCSYEESRALMGLKNPEEVREWARLPGWSCSPEASGAGCHDYCPACTQKQATLNGERTVLNQQLQQVAKIISKWPHWFRRHHGFCPLDCPDCRQEALPAQSRLYDFKEE